MDLLRFPAFRASKVLLVHAGYPYHTEAGYMANVLPRVWCDGSEGIPFAADPTPGAAAAMTHSTVWAACRARIRSLSPETSAAY